MSTAPDAFEAERDLVLERVVPVSRQTVWSAWTEPEHLVRWFAPRPFETTGCEIDLRPGGVFRTVMRSPGGEESASLGCYLEVIAPERLVWTTALGPGFRPISPAPQLAFTAVVTLEPSGDGTRYRVVAMHGSAEGRDRHDELGFHDGWGTALDQLVALFT